MYLCTKFLLIWRTSDFGTKIAKKNMNDKNFDKINLTFEIRIEQCMPVPNFSQFEERQILGPNLAEGGVLGSAYFRK